MWYPLLGFGTHPLTGFGTHSLGLVLTRWDWYSLAGIGTHSLGLVLTHWDWYSLAGIGTHSLGLVLTRWDWYSLAGIGTHSLESARQGVSPRVTAAMPQGRKGSPAHCSSVPPPSRPNCFSWCAAPTEPEVNAVAPEVTPEEPEVTSDEPEVTSEEPEVSPVGPEVSSLGPEVRFPAAPGPRVRDAKALYFILMVTPTAKSEKYDHNEVCFTSGTS